MSVKLFYRHLGGNGEPLIIIHGLYGSSDNWLTIGRQLQNRFEVFIIDQRNHGQSPHSKEMNYDVMADDVKYFMVEHKIKSAIIMGHSMGGKTAMTLALKYPELISKLLIIDIAPKAYYVSKNRRDTTSFHKNIIDALLQVKPEDYKSRSEINNFLAPKIIDATVRSFLLKNISRNDNGSLKWKLNITVIADNLHLIMDGFSDKDYNTFPDNKTVALINGENSAYVKDKDIQELKLMFPSVQTVTIPNAGHWLHAEQPKLFIEALLNFI